MNSDKIIDMSNYYTYRAYSGGYSWMTHDHAAFITKSILENGLEYTLKNSEVWNKIGYDLFNMPYREIDGIYRFVIPVYTETSETDLKIQDLIGKISTILDEDDGKYIYFSDRSKFILYNNDIEIETIDNESDVNIANTAFNIIVMFLLKTLKRGLQ